MDAGRHTLDTAFLAAHRDDDPVRLLLQKERYGGIDIAWVAQQIEGRRQAQAKWPALAFCDDYWYPPRLNREQSSSEATARYKAAAFCHSGTTVADLTGGMGIDSYYFSQKAASVDYCECDEGLFNTTAHNFEALHADNIRSHCGDSLSWLAASQSHFDLLYIDPARRDSHGQKTVAFEDCRPNLLDNLALLIEHSNTLLVKASPMIDLAMAQRQLQSVRQIHIVAVKGECKEVLFVIGDTEVPSPTYLCQNLDSGQQVLTFSADECRTTRCPLCDKVAQYLYEPNAAIMKSGGSTIAGCRNRLLQLSHNTHLFTNETLVADFPGRIFKVEQEVALNTKNVRRLLPEGKCHIVCRNYPVGADVLAKQLKLQEGGERYLIATTIGQRHTGLLCTRMGMK